MILRELDSKDSDVQIGRAISLPSFAFISTIKCSTLFSLRTRRAWWEVICYFWLFIYLHRFYFGRQEVGQELQKITLLKLLLHNISSDNQDLICRLEDILNWMKFKWTSGWYSTKVNPKLSKHKLCDSNMCHFADKNKKNNVTKTEIAFSGDISRGHEKQKTKYIYIYIYIYILIIIIIIIIAIILIIMVIMIVTMVITIIIIIIVIKAVF